MSDHGPERVDPEVSLVRIADALEVLACGSGDASRVATLEDLLKDFVGTMQNSQSTDADWSELLSDVKEALGIE